MKVVPPIDLKAEYAEIKFPLKKRMGRFFKSGRYILGPEVNELEQNFAKFIGTKYAIGVASGTDAILLPLMALSVKPGDEVITTPFTFIATASTISRLGAKPVFVDIEPDTLNINPDLIQQKISSKTKGIIVVHLYGNPCRMNEIKSLAKRHGLFVIEDCAQACGARYQKKRVGSLGDAGAFSFYPTKTLGAAGDAGIVTTNDSSIFEKIKSLRHHGDDGRHHAYNHVRIGINSRLDEIQAAVLNVKLDFLNRWNVKRRRHASYYNKTLKKLKLPVKFPKEMPGCEAVYHQYVLQVKNGQRDKFLSYLRLNGIQAAVYYPTPLHLQPCFQDLGYKLGSFPISEHASKEVLSLPIYPQISRKFLNYILGTLSNLNSGQK